MASVSRFALAVRLILKMSPYLSELWLVRIKLKSTSKRTIDSYSILTIKLNKHYRIIFEDISQKFNFFCILNREANVFVLTLFVSNLLQFQTKIAQLDAPEITRKCVGASERFLYSILDIMIKVSLT